MSDSIPELAVTYNQAWASHDPDAIVACIPRMPCFICTT